MPKPHRAPGDAASRLPFPPGEPPSLADFVTDGPIVSEGEYISLQTALIHEYQRREEANALTVDLAKQYLANRQEPPPAPASKGQQKQKQKRPRADLPPGALRTPEAARYLGIGERTLIKYRDKGEIPCHKIGGAVVYLVVDLDAYLSQNKEQR